MKMESKMPVQDLLLPLCSVCVCVLSSLWLNKGKSECNNEKRRDLFPGEKEEKSGLRGQGRSCECFFPPGERWREKKEGVLIKEWKKEGKGLKSRKWLTQGSKERKRERAARHEEVNNLRGEDGGNEVKWACRWRGWLQWRRGLLLFVYTRDLLWIIVICLYLPSDTKTTRVIICLDERGLMRLVFVLFEGCWM